MDLAKIGNGRQNKSSLGRKFHSGIKGLNSGKDLGAKPLEIASHKNMLNILLTTGDK